MERVRSGQELAFNELVERYQGPVTGFLARMLKSRDEALDAAQEVFIRVHGRAHLYEPSYPFRCWLYRIATNVAIDMVRREKRRGFLLLGDLLGRRGGRDERHDEEEVVGYDPTAETDGALDGMVDGERAALLRQAVATLPAPYRAALVLRDLEEMSYEEVASVLGCQVGTVKSRVNRARNLLREKLGGVLGISGAEPPGSDE
jgi:RNA polymerase sigma-70 factor (ECF subfamily)